MLNYSHSIEKEKFLINQIFSIIMTLLNYLLILKIPQIGVFKKKINNEFSSLGLYLSAHPLDSYSNILLKMNVTNSIEILNEPSKYIQKEFKIMWF